MMKRILLFLLIAASLAGFSACGPQKAASVEDFDIEVYTPAHASGFKIVGAAGRKSTILKVFNPWQGAGDTEKMLFIARNGESAPDGFEGQVVRAGAERIVCMSSTHVAMLHALGQTDRVAGVSGRDYISNDSIRARAESIADVGYDGNVDYESLLSKNPDLVLLFGVSGASGMEPKLLEMHIPFCYIGEYLEESPLGKAEWLVAVAEITDSREQGKKVFEPIPLRYEALKQRAAKADSNPKVMINTPYAGTWFMASTGSYVARLIADAGGDYIYSKNTTNRSLPIDLEEAFLLASEADVWLNAGSASTLGELKSQFPKFASVRCVQAGAVYNCNKRTNVAGGNDYWESGVVQPDVVLHDLIAILHPERLAENDREFYYYQKLE